MAHGQRTWMAGPARWVGLASLLGALLVAVLSANVATAPSASALAPINPVRILDDDPVNSGFLVFVEGDVLLNADESEGTLALGGNLSFLGNYNVAAGSSPAADTFTAPGDASPTYLYVGGGMQWAGSGILRVQNGGFTKIAQAGTYTASNVDGNGATNLTQIRAAGQPYGSTPRIESTTNLQDGDSVAAPVSSDLIDIPSAFTQYRQLTSQMAGCPVTTPLLNPDTGAALTSPFAPGTRGRLTLVAGQTNVLEVAATDLANLSEMTFTSPPTADTPLLINVTGPTFNGRMPNMAGVGSGQAPYILWNYPTATTVTVTGGDSVEGTLYMPNAQLNWIPLQNIEGNVIAASFVHGIGAPAGTPHEVHDFPFATTLSCAEPATLSLVKVVDNTGGGTAVPGDWTLTADGEVLVTGPGGSTVVTDVEVPAGDYDLSESGGPDGYEPGTWSCEGGTLTDDTVGVPAGADVTCRITNTYVPTSPTTSPTTSTTTSPTTSPTTSTTTSPTTSPTTSTTTSPTTSTTTSSTTSPTTSATTSPTTTLPPTAPTTGGEGGEVLPTSAGPTGSGGPSFAGLPVTGAEAATTLLAAIGLLLLGAGLIAGSRSHRH